MKLYIRTCINCSVCIDRYLDYGEQQWKGQVTDHLKDVELYCDEVRKNFEASLDWLHEHACSRSYGLGKYSCIKNTIRNIKSYYISEHLFTLSFGAPCGMWIVRIDPLHFLARCRKRWLNQALSVLSVSVGFLCVCCRAIRHGDSAIKLVLKLVFDVCCGCRQQNPVGWAVSDRVIVWLNDLHGILYGVSFAARWIIWCQSARTTGHQVSHTLC